MKLAVSNRSRKLAVSNRSRKLACWRLVLFGCALGALALVGRLAIRRDRPQPPADSSSAAPTGLPQVVQSRGYVSSAACQMCHPRQYSTWHATYHRRMTQPATGDAVLAPFAGEEFTLGTETIRLTRRDDEFWVEKRLPSGPFKTSASGPIVDARRIVMTTGSHHMQGFWVRRNNGNLLDQLPLMWLIESDGKGRWVPRDDSFLKPPDDHTTGMPWNMVCIFCHSVGGVPGVDMKSRTAETTVAELGIACEACHGPGQAHVAAHELAPRELLSTKAADVAAANDRGDATIVQPKRLEPVRSAQVCGQCHAVAKFATSQIGADWLPLGSRYRPGDDLTQSRTTLSPSCMPPGDYEAVRKDGPSFWESNFWPDGMVRVVGREYNGLLESICYQRGGLTCLDCHSLHESDPNDQLAAGMNTNEACFGCHASFREGIERHTHHAADSSGSLCYNCHMPHTTYGLFKATRSHQISSPSIANTLLTGRPNACNLCHLDQTLAWSATELSDWYGQESVKLDPDQGNVSAAILWILSGDAVQRALLAWSCGWESARQASGGDRMAPFLATLLEDDYSAVRRVAERSLKAIGYPLDYDFLGPVEARAAAKRQVIERWKSGTSAGDGNVIDRLLLNEDGGLREDEIERLSGGRDNHAVSVNE
jgi:predicted CXXCH cytochrome family protein